MGLLIKQVAVGPSGFESPSRLYKVLFKHAFDFLNRGYFLNKAADTET